MIICADNRKTYHQVVPLSERRSTLQQYHDARTSEYLGVYKILERVSERSYWTGLQQDVRNYVLGCSQCRKRKNRAATFMQLDQTGFPMERVATDIIMGPLPGTNDGNKYELVVADYFTKWTDAYLPKNMEAQTVAETLVEQFITRFGVPTVIHCVLGRQNERSL